MKLCQHNTAQPAHTAQPAFPIPDHRGLFAKGGLSKRDWTCHIIAERQHLALMWWTAGFDVAKPLSWAKRKDQQLQLSVFTQFNFCSFSCSSCSSKHFCSSLLCPCQFVMISGTEGQSFGSKTLGKEWPDPWAVNVPNPPWCAGGHGSCTKNLLSQQSVTYRLLIHGIPSLIIVCQEKNPGWKTLWSLWRIFMTFMEDNLLWWGR